MLLTLLQMILKPPGNPSAPAAHDPACCPPSPVYRPTCSQWQRRQCVRLKLPLTRILRPQAPPTASALRNCPPSRVYRTHGDGNCLFRCLSRVLTGSESHHVLVRARIVEHILRRRRVFASLLPGPRDKSAERYVSRSKMRVAGTWGSDVEILAAAHLLRTKVFVYTKHGDTWQWVEHNLDLTAPRSRPCKEAIYLQHTDLVHYDLVEGVKAAPGGDDNRQYARSVESGKATSKRKPNRKCVLHAQRWGRDTKYKGNNRRVVPRHRELKKKRLRRLRPFKRRREKKSLTILSTYAQTNCSKSSTKVLLM